MITERPTAAALLIFFIIPSFITVFKFVIECPYIDCAHDSMYYDVLSTYFLPKNCPNIVFAFLLKEWYDLYIAKTSQYVLIHILR